MVQKLYLTPTLTLTLSMVHTLPPAANPARYHGSEQDRRQLREQVTRTLTLTTLYQQSNHNPNPNPDADFREGVWLGLGLALGLRLRVREVMIRVRVRVRVTGRGGDLISTHTCMRGRVVRHAV